MIMSALYFWESSTNTFQLPCGMITPTFFDVVAIIDLQPTGDTFEPTIKNQTKPNFTFDHVGFNAYIKDHNEQT